MQNFLDYIAVLAFVIVFFITKDVFLATSVLMAGVTIQVVAYWLLKKTIGNELKITFWASIILGGMTLILRDEKFIQWKPTIVNWLLGLSLVGAHAIGRIFLLKKLLASAMVLPDHNWFVLTYAWALSFFALGGLNLWVAYSYSMETWVTFKFAGMLVINLFLLVCTFTYLYRCGLLSEANLPNPQDKDPADIHKSD